MRVVTIPVREYRGLLKDSARLEIIRTYCESTKYIDKEDLKYIAGMFERAPQEDESEEEE